MKVVIWKQDERQVLMPTGLVIGRVIANTGDKPFRDKLSKVFKLVYYVPREITS